MALTQTLLANKRQVLIAFFLVVGTVGATYLVVADSNSELDRVPARTDVVVSIDPDVTDAPTTRAVLNHLLDRARGRLGQAYDGPANDEALLANVSSRSELDRDGVHRVTLFATYDVAEPADQPASVIENGSYFGVLIESDWRESAVRRAAGNESAYRKRSDGAYTIYEPRERRTRWIGVLGGGTYVIGTENAVREAIAVDRGQQETVGGVVRNTFQGTRSGEDVSLRFAARFPEQDELTNVSGEQYRIVDGITAVSGSAVRTDRTVQTRLNIHANSRFDAEDLQTVTEAELTKATYNTSSRAIRRLYSDVAVGRDGSTVTATLESSPRALADGIDAVGGDWLALYLSGIGDDDAEITVDTPTPQR